MRSLHTAPARYSVLATFTVAALSPVAYLPDELFRRLGLRPAYGWPAGIALVTTIIVLLGASVGAFRQLAATPVDGGEVYGGTRGKPGRLPGLLAVASLLITAVIAVAAAVSAGVRALVSLLPVLAGYTVVLAVATILLICLLHIRGVRVAPAIYALSSALFSCGVLITLAIGVYQPWGGGAGVAPGASPDRQLTTVLAVAALGASSAIFIGAGVLAPRAVGCRIPRTRLGHALAVGTFVVLITLIGGISWFAARGDLPRPSGSILAQLARRVYGPSAGWYLVQGATAIILVAAAHTPFTGVARLMAPLARAGYLPRHLAAPHGRRAHADAAVIFAVCAIALVLGLRASPARLSPLLVISACASFALSQLALAAYWAGSKLPGRRRSLLGHTAAAAAACVTLVLFGGLSFAAETWAAPILVALLAGVLLAVRHHARRGLRSRRAS